MVELFSYALSYNDIGLLVLVAILIGMAKTGIAGAGMIAIPLMAIAFGSKASTGLLLTILIFADCFAVQHYRHHANWAHLKRLLPFALVGVLVGTLVGNSLNDELFSSTMAVIIFISLAIMLWLERNAAPTMPSSLWFVAIIGMLGGFTTMVGNLAGPVMALYLLAMRLPKNEFIGTAAWFFLCINLLKVPFHVFVWGTITLNSTMLSLALTPAIASGALVGVWLIKQLNETLFRYLIILMTAAAAILMIS